MAIAYGISGDFQNCGSRSGIFVNQNFWRCEVIDNSVGGNTIGPSSLCLRAVVCCLSTNVLTRVRFRW